MKTHSTKVELALHDTSTKKQIKQLFDDRGVPSSGATFNFFRHEIVPHLNGSFDLVGDQITMMRNGELFDIDTFLNHAHKGKVNIHDYVSVISKESKARMLSYPANDWSQHAVGKGEMYVHLLTLGSVKGTSHDISYSGGIVEVKGNRSRLSSSTCVTDLELVIKTMTHHIKDLPLSDKTVFQKLNKHMVEHVYSVELSVEQYTALIERLAVAVYDQDPEFVHMIAKNVFDDDLLESTKKLLSIVEFHNYQNHVKFDNLLLLQPDTGDAIVMREYADVMKHWRDLKLALEYDWNNSRSNTIAWSLKNEF